MCLFFQLHGGDSPVECETCGEMFWDQTTLKQHQRLHIAEAREPDYEPEEDNNNGMSTIIIDKFYIIFLKKL